VQAWGGQVLWARDAAHARRLILEVAQRHRVASVVKSKSMTTEEIGLNPALAAAGLKTLETDLGEFIVQLAGHPPAHLTAPALHLSRGQIAGLFEERLGHCHGPEPETLTRQAAAYLEPHYWQAHLGITGVNFAAPDGTLVLLENENNLRLTATLPGVHLALMGMEKIIPSLAQAEVLLRLLPPSATGQRLTALVHFIRGLKANQAFYLVILDNGRRRLAADPELAEALQPALRGLSQYLPHLSVGRGPPLRPGLPRGHRHPPGAVSGAPGGHLGPLHPVRRLPGNLPGPNSTDG
jgi:L-lactate dehydrogenase complex protein LldF